MQRNDNCAQTCIDVIRAVMQHQPVPGMREGVTLEALFAFSKMHSVEALMFHALCELDVNEEDAVWLHWQNRAEMLLTQSIVQLADRDLLFDVMAEAGVDLLPVKGCWLKEAYPEIDYRQMSDLDMLIRRKDRSRVREMLLGMGYEPESGEVAAHHDGYEKKPYTIVEMHLQLLSSTDPNAGYYENIWERAQPTKDRPRIYRLSCEDEYIYYLLHLKKHLEEAGCGIRLILDSVAFRAANPNMDRAYLQREFEKLRIAEFAAQIEQLADCWFVTGEALPEHLRAMGEGILWAGTYGSLENALDNRMDKLREKYRSPLVRMAAYWGSRFCRPLSEMKAFYPILEKLPVLLPACWVARIAKKCVTKPKALLYHIQHIYKEGMKNGQG